MKLCVIVRAPAPDCPATAIARSAADHGHEVHLLIAPVDGGADPAPGRIHDRATIHRLPADSPGWWGRLAARRIRNAAIARLLRAIDPEVIHLADRGDLRIVTPPGAIVLANGTEGPSSRDVDATVLLDGQIVDRSGRLVPSPGVPPKAAGAPVLDGLDPSSSTDHWRVLTYLGCIDQLRRERRLRPDHPHRRTGPALGRPQKRAPSTAEQARPAPGDPARPVSVLRSES